MRVSGNLNVAALQVLHAENFQVQGTASGLSVVQPPNINGALAGNNAAGAVQKTSLPAQSGNNDQPSIIIVEFLGFGGGDGSTEPAPQTDKRRRSDNSPAYDPGSAFQLLGNGSLTQQQQNNLTDEEKGKLKQIEHSAL